MSTETPSLAFPEHDLPHLLTQLLEAMLAAHVRIEQLSDEVSEQARRGSEQAVRNNAEHIVTELGGVVAQAEATLIQPLEERLVRISQVTQDLEQQGQELAERLEEAREGYDTVTRQQLLRLEEGFRANERTIASLVSPSAGLVAGVRTEVDTLVRQSEQTISILKQESAKLYDLHPARALESLQLEVGLRLKDVHDRLRPMHLELEKQGPVLEEFRAQIASSTRSLTGGLSSVGATLSNLSEGVTALRDRIDALTHQQAQLKAEQSGVVARTTALEARIDNLVKTLERQNADGRAIAEQHHQQQVAHATATFENFQQTMDFANGWLVAVAGRTRLIALLAVMNLLVVIRVIVPDEVWQMVGHVFRALASAV